MSDVAHHSSLDPNNVISITDPLNGNAVLKGVDIDVAQGLFGAFGSTVSPTGASFAVSSASANEGSTLSFTISIQTPIYTETPDYKVYYATSDGTAIGGQDYTAVGATPLDFTASSAQSYTISVHTQDNTQSNGTKTLYLVLYNNFDQPFSPLIEGAGTIVDQAPPTNPPVLSKAGNGNLYVSGGLPLIVDAGLKVTDASATQLTGATVAITMGFLAGDVLTFSNQNGITGSYNSASRTLVLSGLSSVANYQAALESVTFNSTASDATNGGTDNTRTISWAVSDSQSTSASVISGVDVWPPSPPSSPPVLSGARNTDSYRSTGSAVYVDGGLIATDSSTANLLSATVTIGPGLLAGDTLNVPNLYGITNSYNSTSGTVPQAY